jgi:hypothetical protein
VERGDSGFEVAPTRIGGGGRPGRPARRPPLTILVVIALAAAVPTIAWIGPRIEYRPEIDLSFIRPTPTPAPSTTPRPTPRPTKPLPTPLPAVTIGTGPAPTERFAIDANGLRFVDPVAGTLGPPMGPRLSSDAVFPAAGGGWWCICFLRNGDVDSEIVTTRLRRLSADGASTANLLLGEYRSSAPGVDQDFYIRFDLELAPDGRTAWLASATRAADTWTIVLEGIDLASGRIVTRAELGSMAFPAPPDPDASPAPDLVQNYFSGPFMRLSPDGRSLLLWSWSETHTDGPGGQVNAGAGWLVGLPADPVADPSIGSVPLATNFADALRSCYWTAWSADDRLVSACWPNEVGRRFVQLVVHDPTGAELGHVDLVDASNSWFGEPVFDRANQAVFVWQPEGHILSRADLASLTVQATKVDPTAPEPAGGAPPMGLPRPADWASLASDFRVYSTPQLVPEPGGERLFAIGVNARTDYSRFGYASTGVWVFDSADGRLLDRWGAVAAYQNLGVSADGRWLYAAGAPGVDDQGKESQWEASLTIHDLADGRPAAQLGQLGADVQVLLVGP